MSASNVHKLLFKAATVAGLVLGSFQASAAPTSLVVFGDSLSDPGNMFALSSLFVPPLPAPIPSLPYVNGRFSNGPVAAEYLASHLGVPTTNYAYAGASTGLTNPYFAGQPPAFAPLFNTGMTSQLNTFTASLGPGGADSGALYFVMGGANDFLEGGLADPIGTLNTAIGNLVNIVSTLYGAGARDFFLPLLPDLGATPRIQAQGPVAMAQARGLSLLFNASLVGAYEQLAAALPDESFTYFDTLAAQDEISAQTLLAGGSTSVPCVVAQANPTCSGFFFFDDIHPTTAVHAGIASRMMLEIPEPGTLALVGVALFAVGRRRLRAQA